MDNWLYRVLKDTLDLHKVSTPQAKALLKRIMQIIFSDENKQP